MPIRRCPTPPLGWLLKTTDPLGRTTKLEYDTAGNVTTLTDALNQVTRFTYDPANGNLLTTTDPLNHTTTIAYNPFGQPLTVTDAEGNVTQLEYDEVGKRKTLSSSSLLSRM